MTRCTADQREAVRAALEELGEGATAEAVSDRVVLPVWVVTRRMAEIEAHGGR